MRPIWKGHISFGLVNIGVTLYSAEKRNDLHFKLLDGRNQASIHYERVNEETGHEVPWNSVVKAYELNDGNYVVLTDDDFKKVAIENLKTIEIEAFINSKELDYIYFEKPYYLVPDNIAAKGYVLLREILKQSRKIGISRVLIHSRQYLAALIPYNEALVLNLLRYPQELRPLKEFEFPNSDIKKYKISSKEIDIATQLVAAMSTTWNPKLYHDEYREALLAWIEKKAKTNNKSTKQKSLKEPKEAKQTKVVDFMELLKKSIESKKASKAPRRKRKAR